MCSSRAIRGTQPRLPFSPGHEAVAVARYGIVVEAVTPTSAWTDVKEVSVEGESRRVG